VRFGVTGSKDVEPDRFRLAHGMVRNV